VPEPKRRLRRLRAEREWGREQKMERRRCDCEEEEETAAAVRLRASLEQCFFFKLGARDVGLR